MWWTIADRSALVISSTILSISRRLALLSWPHLNLLFLPMSELARRPRLTKLKASVCLQQRTLFYS